MTRPLDLVRLFATLDEHDVEYLVIGGVATQVHGHRRTTKDLDVMPDPALGNHERLAAALAELDAQLRDDPDLPAPRDAEQLRAAPIVPPLLTRHGELHVVNEPKGAGRYPDLRARALVLELDGIEVAIVGLDDLIRMKRATGRRADLDDIAVLSAVARE